MHSCCTVKRLNICRLPATDVFYEGDLSPSKTTPEAVGILAAFTSHTVLYFKKGKRFIINLRRKKKWWCEDSDDALVSSLILIWNVV